MKRSLLETLRERAQDLHDAGDMTDVTQRELDALCLPSVPAFTPKQIRRIRLRTLTSQVVFACYLNTSKYTVQKWEQGTKKPNGPSLKLLDVADRKGLEALT